MSSSKGSGFWFGGRGTSVGCRRMGLAIAILVTTVGWAVSQQYVRWGLPSNHVLLTASSPSLPSETASSSFPRALSSDPQASFPTPHPTHAAPVARLLEPSPPPAVEWATQSLTQPLLSPSISPHPPVSLATQTTPPTHAPKGLLRLGNQTTHPLRVALLSRHSHPATPKAKLGQSSSEPVHWDFSPGEGGRNGLILSLPDGDLQISPGDVLVVFAQDGSRRYWGPYVVGETPLPYWNEDRQEWQILVQP